MRICNVKGFCIKCTEYLVVIKPYLHPKKDLFYIWWDRKGVVYYEIFHYLDKLKDAVARKWLKLASRKGGMVFIAITLHTILFVRNKLLSFI